MPPDQLNEEGPAEPEEIEIPFNIIFLFSILLIISLLARILFWIFEFWIILQDMLFYWYFLLHFNCYIRHKEIPLDSTKSRDQPIDQQMLLEVPAPVTEVLRHIRPQINLLWNNHIDEIPSIVTVTGNITHIIHDFINLPMNASILYVFDPPKVQQDKHFQEFLRGKIHCQNFINQDLNFYNCQYLRKAIPISSGMPTPHQFHQ